MSQMGSVSKKIRVDLNPSELALMQFLYNFAKTWGSVCLLSVFFRYDEDTNEHSRFSDLRCQGQVLLEAKHVLKMGGDPVTPENLVSEPAVGNCGRRN